MVTATNNGKTTTSGTVVNYNKKPFPNANVSIWKNGPVEVNPDDQQLTASFVGKQNAR